MAVSTIGSSHCAPPDPQRIREHLAAVLASPQFAKSARLKRFLEYIVEAKLACRNDDIQEYNIGLQVYDRRETFDPRVDSIVRVEAHRLRERLAGYYATDGKAQPFRIELPERGYTPAFVPFKRTRIPSSRIGLALASAAILFALVYAVLLVRRPHEPPPQAREAFEKGLAAWQQWTAQSASQAEALFQQAVAIDPEYARAYAWLSAAHRARATMGDADPREVHVKSMEAARKAIALDPQLADAHLAMATSLTLEADWIGAEKAYRTAIRLAPENPEIHHAFGIVFLAASPARLAEAEAELRQAVHLKPGDLGNQVVLGMILYFRGRFDEARSILEEMLKIRSLYPGAMRILAAVLVQTGEFSRAIRLHEQAQKLAHLSWGEGLLGHALAVSGDGMKAREILNTLESRFATKPVSALAIGTIYAGLEEWAPACQWLDRAWSNFEIRARFIAVDPIYAPLRSQACFTELLRKTGLSQLDTPIR